MGTPGHADPAWQRVAAAWFTGRLDDDEDACIVVVEVDGQVVATAMGAIRDAAPSPAVPGGCDVLVSNIATLPEARCRGHARAAFEEVMRWAVDTGVDRAELMATDAGRSMYEGAGFRETSYPAMRAQLG